MLKNRHESNYEVVGGQINVFQKSFMIEIEGESVEIRINKYGSRIHSQIWFYNHPLYFLGDYLLDISPEEFKEKHLDKFLDVKRKALQAESDKELLFSIAKDFPSQILGLDIRVELKKGHQNPIEVHIQKNGYVGVRSSKEIKAVLSALENGFKVTHVSDFELYDVPKHLICCGNVVYDVPQRKPQIKRFARIRK